MQSNFFPVFLESHCREVQGSSQSAKSVHPLPPELLPPSHPLHCSQLPGTRINGGPVSFIGGCYREHQTC